MGHKPIQAVIFDFDGLIFDSETPEYQSWSDIYAEYGVHLAMDTWCRFVGTDGKGFNPYDHLEQLLGDVVDRSAVRTRRRARYIELTEVADVRPGVRDYITTADVLGLKIGLASSSPRHWVTSYLDKFGLPHLFETICTREDVTDAKPHPELYLKSLQALGVTNDESLAFEDSPSGAMAAKAAGISCVIVPNELTANLQFDKVDFRLTSFEEMDLSTLINVLQGESKGERPMLSG